MAPSEFLSCDWGTTSFRLRWISGPELRVVREIRERAGIKAMLERVPDPNPARRAEAFARFLAVKLSELIGTGAPPVQRLPLVISGMASSSVGWQELPYANAPLALDAARLVSAELDWEKPKWVGQTHLVSGVATGNDMMRGEECEIIGLMALPGLAEMREQCLLILPGTHSKHISIRDRSVIEWRTFMTGELFEVIGQHSLLRASLDLRSGMDLPPCTPTHRLSFVEGVRAACEHGLAAGLFQVRTRAVLQRTSASENTAFFSGLLIGAELSDVKQRAGQQPLVLAGSHKFTEAYACAIRTIADSSLKWSQVPGDEVERSTIRAHALFLEKHAAAQ